jgi:DNA-binding response OmpR family regulator
MRILIADDDPLTLEALQACLVSEGFVPLPAWNGTEALAVWREQKPDLCCLDIMMPGVDGFEVCRQIRAADARVPVLFLSAKSEEIDVVVGLRLGADDFVRKPFGKHEFLARVHAALRRAQPAGCATACVSFVMRELKVFPKELRCERGKVSVELSPRECAILELLHAHAGEVVSRDELLNRCWGMEYYPESRTLDQHIAKLRKKIEPPNGKHPLIETVRGLGYRYRP